MTFRSYARAELARYVYLILHVELPWRVIGMSLGTIIHCFRGETDSDFLFIYHDLEPGMLQDSSMIGLNLCFRLLLRVYVDWGVVFCCPVDVSNDRDNGYIHTYR